LPARTQSGYTAQAPWRRPAIARSSPQSTQRYPLTWVLGTETNVRLLRELSRHGGQLSAPSLVARTGLAKTSVWAGLAVLEQTGAISVAGTGRARLYSMRPGYVLRASLDTLFEAEERRFQNIFESIREAARACRLEPAAIWLYGSAARGDDRLGSDLDLVVVGTQAPSHLILDAMRDALHAAGEQFGFAASVVGLGTADIARLVRERDPWWAEVAREAVVIAGHRPDELARQTGAVTKRRTAA
jgi:predicted nucleotidyltransferase